MCGVSVGRERCVMCVACAPAPSAAGSAAAVPVIATAPWGDVPAAVNGIERASHVTRVLTVGKTPSSQLQLPITPPAALRPHARTRARRGLPHPPPGAGGVTLTAQRPTFRRTAHPLTAHADAALFLLFLLYTTARGGAPHTAWGRETRGGGPQRPAPTSHSPDDHALATERRKVLAASAAAGGHWRWAKSSSATRCFTSPGATLHSRCASAVPRSPPAAFVAA